VWFLGKADAAKIRGNPHLAKTNYGYDDERGDYVVTMNDHVGFRCVCGGGVVCVCVGMQLGGQGLR
jgi:hypothetical protein